MQPSLDYRGVLLTTWLTLLLGSIGSTLTFNYYANTQAIVPQTLGHTWAMVLTLWLGGVLGAMLVILLGWSSGWRQAFLTAFTGYGIGVFIRLIFLGQFLDNSTTAWELLSNIVTLGSIPPYQSFWALVWLGGVLLLVFTVVLVTELRITLDTPSIPLVPRYIGASAALMSISLLSVVALRNTTAQGVNTLDLVDTQWLLLPQTNMIIAALLGFVIGGAYVCETREAAALTLFFASTAHVVAMLLVTPVVADFDALYVNFDPNRIGVLHFVFFWVGTPLTGAIAAFALHNLRDAFALGEV